MNFENKFGNSALFVNSSLTEEGTYPSSSQAALLKEGIHVMSCSYEERTLWGIEVGWSYGSTTADILTGFKMHCHGWRSVYCMPKRPAFRGTAPINLSDRLNQISTFASLLFIALFISIFASAILELRWSGVSIEEWWRNEQFWVIGSVSGHLFAIVQGFLKALAKANINFSVVSKAPDDGEFRELYTFRWTALLIPPTTIIIINLVGIAAGITDAINSG